MKSKIMKEKGLPKKYSAQKISDWLDNKIEKAFVRVFDGGLQKWTIIFCSL